MRGGILGGDDGHFQGIAKSSACFESTFQTEADDGAESPLEVLESPLVILVIFVADVADPGHEGLLL